MRLPFEICSPPYIRSSTNCINKVQTYRRKTCQTQTNLTPCPRTCGRPFRPSDPTVPNRGSNTQKRLHKPPKINQVSKCVASDTNNCATAASASGWNGAGVPQHSRHLHKLLRERKTRKRTRVLLWEGLLGWEGWEMLLASEPRQR